MPHQQKELSMPKHEQRQRRFLLAQLNTYRRLDRKPEIKRFRGKTRDLLAAVDRAGR